MATERPSGTGHADGFERESIPEWVDAAGTGHDTAEERERDWTPIDVEELEALLAIETMVREALDADLPLADVFVRVAKSHLAALDEVRDA